MLKLVLNVAKKADVKVAIGGGIAVHVHGFRRETADVDAFFHGEDRQKVLRALHLLAADDYDIEELHFSHWIAVPHGAGPDERIDLLFATGDPEESSIELAVRKRYRAITAPVFPVDMLIVCKFLADREDPKDWLDIHTLYKRGAYSLDEIVNRFHQMGQGADAKRFLEFMALLEKVSKVKKGDAGKDP